MAKYLNADYWKKAYLLEFKINGVVTDAFTFSVAPESEDFTFPQRRNETKTFGGAIISDYGNDLVQISLSGSTINQEVKYIYKSKLGDAALTGEEEIFYLRDLLKKYGRQENLQGKEVYLYSLNGGGDNVKNNPKWWKIYVGELNINRDKSKPFCYNYKLTAVGEPEVTRKKISGGLIKGGLAEFVNSWYESLTSEDGFLAKMTSTANKIEEVGGMFITDISTAITKTRNCIDAFNSSISRYVDVVNGILSGIGDVATDTVMLGDKILYTAFRYYPTLVTSVWNTALELVETCNELADYCCSMDKYFNTNSFQTVKEIAGDTASNQDISDVYSTLGHNMTIYANMTFVVTSKNINNLGVAVIPGEAGVDDTLTVTYGYKVVSLTESETNWDQLASDFYGDASLSNLLAVYNGQYIDSELKVGQVVLIPKLNFAESKILENEIYNNPDVKDNYGKDLIILNNDFSINNNDLKLISGADNLQQALLNRYSTFLGARIRLEVYGIQASIGDALTASSSLIQASVHQTTVEDPRIDTVEKIDFKGMGDKLQVVVTYVDKNGNKQNFGGML